MLPIMAAALHVVHTWSSVLQVLSGTALRERKNKQKKGRQATQQAIKTSQLTHRCVESTSAAATEVPNMFTLQSSVVEQSSMASKQCSDSVVTEQM